MSLPLVIYLIDTVSGLSVMFGIAFVIGCLYLAANLWRYVDAHTVYTDEDQSKRAKANLGKWWIVALLGLIGCLFPSKETGYTMLAAYGLESIADNPRIQGIADNSLKLIEKKIGEYLNEETKESK